MKIMDVDNNIEQRFLLNSSQYLKSPITIELSDVSYHFPGKKVDVLHNINLTIKSGKKIAIVGENGAGKSTFIKLILRLYVPTDGVILLNDIDINKYNLNDYWNMFSVVFQDFKLFSFPLCDNIATNHITSDDTNDKLYNIIEAINLDKTIKSANKGIYTYINKDFDEEGINFSGGEEQKIAIARALYRDASFIIMDEPTSALDPSTELEIFNLLNELLKDKGVIYISHRMATVKYSNRIIVFDKGEIIEDGEHDSLYNNQSKYYQMYSTQENLYK